MFEMKFTGFKEVEEALNRAEKLGLDALVDSVDESGEHLIGVAMQLAPKLSGDLEGGGTKDAVKVLPGEVSVEVGFRGLPYAERMHEGVYSLGTISSGKPQVDGMSVGRKYLERPLIKYFETYIKEWAAAIKRALGG